MGAKTRKLAAARGVRGLWTQMDKQVGMQANSYRFGPFELDPVNFQLRDGGDVRHVEPMVFDLLHFMVRNPGRLITRDDIIESVWRGRIVSDTTISSCVKSVRKALGDSGEAQSYIRTQRGRGFQFVADVMLPEPVQQEIAIAAVAAPPEAPAGAPRDPLLLVLPFEAGGTEGASGVAAALVDTLMTLLQRVPLLGVISRATAQALVGQPETAMRMAEGVAADYLVEGRVQLEAGSCAANIRLVDALRGTQLWAQRFEAAVGPTLVRTLSDQILVRLEPQLMRAIHADMARRGGSQSSRQLLLQAITLTTVHGWHRDTFGQAAALLRRSIALEPELALTHAHLSLVLGLGHRVGLLRETPQVVADAEHEAELALGLDSMDPHVLGLAGCTLADIGQTGRAIPILHQAIDLDPANAQAESALGSAYLIEGRLDAAVLHLGRGVEISPIDPRAAVWGALLACAYLGRGEGEAARDAAQAASRADHRNYLPRVVGCAVELAAGDDAAARVQLAEARRIKPDLSQAEIDLLVGAETGGRIAAL